MVRPSRAVQAENRRALRSRMEQRIRRRRLIRRIFMLMGTVILIIGIALVASTFTHRGTPVSGESFALQGRDHILTGATHPAYNSVPPTSGWHYADQVASWGVSASPIPNEIQLHNLEHGGIVIQYHDARDTALVGQLTTFAQSYPTKVLLAPYTDMPDTVAMTAWGHRQTFDRYNEPAMRAFIAAFINKGPEEVP